MVVILFFLAITPGVSENVLLEVNRRVCLRFAKPHGLQLAPGSYQLFAYKIPLKLQGNYLGRTLLFRFSPGNNEWGPGLGTLYVLRAKSAEGGSALLRKRGFFQKGEALVGDPEFDRCIATRSRPVRFAANLLSDPGLRKKVRRLICPIEWGPKRLTITKGGRIELLEVAGFLTVRHLEDRFTLLSELANALERDPRRFENGPNRAAPAERPAPLPNDATA